MFFEEITKIRSILDSRYLSYFLSASDELFQTRKNRDGKWIVALKNKFQDTDKLSKKIGLDEEGVSSKPLNRAYTEKERGFLLEIDQAEEISRNNLELFSRAEQLTRNLEELYASLSGKIFELADIFHKMSSNFRKLEGFMGQQVDSGASGKLQLSESYNFLKITLFAFSNSLKLNSEGVLKQLLPFCSKNIERISGQKDMFKLKQSLELRHRSLCQRMDLDSVISLVPEPVSTSGRPVRKLARSLQQDRSSQTRKLGQKLESDDPQGKRVHISGPR